MSIVIPDFCLVLVFGASPTSARAAAAQLFATDEMVPPALAAGALEAIVERRLAARALTVVDVSAASAAQRTELLRIAKRTYTQPVAIAILSDPAEAGTRNQGIEQLQRRLERDGVHATHVLREQSTIAIARERLPTDFRGLEGPFDIIGDVHGCVDELETLLDLLGYRITWSTDGERRRVSVETPPGRRLIFVGDLVDRGPRAPDALRIAMSAAETGGGFCLPGNHDVKFARWLAGRNVSLNHGLERTVEQMAAEPASFHQAAKAYLDSLPSHMWCDGGRLVVAHAGLTAAMIGRSTGAVREFCLYGDTDGDTDAHGLTIRYHWAAHYRGDTTVIYGHTPVADAVWYNNTLCLDTGCCFGNKLTALRWPEREIVCVPALREYAPPRRLFGHPPLRPAADG